MISVGDKVPSVTISQATSEGPKPANPAELFAGKKVVLFTLPGAFTPTCSQKHLPGFVEKLPELQGQGVDIVACLSVNDAFTMKAWAESAGALDKITMLADGNGDFAKALGIDVDLSKFGMGTRASRGLLMFDDGKLTKIDMEEPGKFDVSSAEACLVSLGK